MSFREQKMNEIASQNVGTHGSCVRSIRLTSKEVDELTSRQLAGHWSGRTGRASLHAPCTQRDKESKAKEYLSYKLEIMNREQKERLHYIAPRCTVVPVEEEGFICVSPRFDPAGSTTETNYDDKGEHDMGSVYFGDESTVAPAKKNNSLWEEEEE